MIHICIVNHNHDEMITNTTNFSDLSKEFNVVIKSNTPASDKLIDYCSKAKIPLLDKDYGYGFSKNNNYVYSFLESKEAFGDDDYFLVMNPDIEIDPKNLHNLIENIKVTETDIAAINLFRDSNYQSFDNSIKRFPTLLTPWLAYLKSERDDTYDKSIITEATKIDWSAGSFLAFKHSTYKALGGFDEDFFMYFEDVDICKRASENGYTLTYFPEVKAVHYAAFDNRKVLSKAFIWYLTSYLRYHFKCSKRWLTKK